MNFDLRLTICELRFTNHGKVRRIRVMFNDYTIIIIIIIKKSGKQYVSLCLENMVAGCGMTKEEAVENK